MNMLSNRAKQAIETYQEANEALKTATERKTLADKELRRATRAVNELSSERNGARDNMVKEIARSAS